MEIEADGIAQGLALRYWKKTSNLRSKQKINHQEHLNKLLTQITYLKNIRSRKIFVEVLKVCLQRRKPSVKYTFKDMVRQRMD